MRSKRVFVAGLLGLALAGAAVAGSATASSSKATVRGAGSTFAAPFVSLLASSYNAATIQYNPIGSGGGITAITNRQVDFGASDAPFTHDQSVACKGCVQIPFTLSGTSVPYNVSGVPDGLKITGPILAKIYLGQVTKWSNPAIKKLNPGAHLPNLKITPVFRSDSSGTTYNFTQFLSRVSAPFKRQVGNSTQVNFPVGVGGKGSSGLAAAVSNTNGAIGYVDVAYSIKNGFKYFRVRNKAGNFLFPNAKTISAAAKSVEKVPKSNALDITYPARKYTQAYPICTYTYALVALKSKQAAALKKFLNWAVTTGQKVPGATKLFYIPIGKKVQAASLATIKRIHG